MKLNVKYNDGEMYIKLISSCPTQDYAVDISLTGPVFVPGVAGEWLQAKTVERHV